MLFEEEASTKASDLESAALITVPYSLYPSTPPAAPSLPRALTIRFCPSTPQFSIDNAVPLSAFATTPPALTVQEFPEPSALIIFDLLRSELTYTSYRERFPPETVPARADAVSDPETL